MMCVIQWSFFFLERILFFTWVATSIYVSHLIARDYKYNSTSQKKKKSTFRVYIEGSRKKQRLRKIGLSFFALTLDKANDEKPIIHHLNLVCVMLFSLDFCCLSFIRFIRCS